MPDDASRDVLARACADKLWQEDRASRGLGIAVEAIAAGHARVAMTVTEAMTNGHGNCHGGFIFTLADSAFGLASNTYNQHSVAQHCAISFLRPARLGDRLVAEAVERFREHRQGIYDIRVLRAGEVIAEFRGHSRTTAGTYFPG
jgi:acyl-CoA thioesterase